MSEYRANRLIREKSPYLLQHAHQPVDWYPWGPEAFERAVREDRPIFLSIGYSSCHWCHVMSHESFEDPAIAALLNRGYISIKVDREERPDIDQVYMAVCQVMTGQGGWPLTLILTPDKKPFFAATYLPRDTRAGLPGLRAVLPRLEEIWRTRREEIEPLTREVIRALTSEKTEPSHAEPSLHLLERAYQQLSDTFDPAKGGFGAAPKFPLPSLLIFLLRIWDRTRDPQALCMVETTLRAMRRGGIFDQIGYGFHRYSVDPAWILPHFEKMLYDQALLAIAYLEAFQAMGDREYARTAREIFTYVLRDLQAEGGGFYAGEDADSEGVEGRYYLWTWEELEGLLDPSDLSLFARVYGVRKEGNIPHPLHGVPPDVNLFFRSESLEDTARELGIPAEELEVRLDRMHALLREARSHRVRPLRDTKILTDWNGFMIAALAIGGRVLGAEEYLVAARRAEESIRRGMQRRDGRLNHVYSPDEAHIDAFAADYAAFAWAEFELFQSTFEPEYLAYGLDWMGILAREYRDPEEGGYFFTPANGEPLLVRKKDAYDGVTPSAYSLAVYLWLRLASLTGKSELRERGLEDWKAVASSVEASPTGFTFLLLAADYFLGPTQEVVIAGGRESPDTQEMLRALRSAFLPQLTVLVRSGSDSDHRLADLAPGILAFPSAGGPATAYVCRGNRCLPPTQEVGQMIRYLTSPNGI